MGSRNIRSLRSAALAIALAPLALLAAGCDRMSRSDGTKVVSPSTAIAACSPTGAHDQYAAAGLSCRQCHPGGAAPQHDAAWMDTASAGFHAISANSGIAGCETCHGPALDGVGGSTSISCAACHGAAWRTSCTMCHGAGDNLTGAPPRATWGNGGDPLRVGAHTAHVTGGALAPAYDCGVCHPKPADALDAGHIDGSTATVTFAGMAVNGGPAPAWSRATGTCSNTYCHGATLKDGTKTAPGWALGAGEAACGTCHGAPPTTGHPAVTGGLAACNPCHPATVDASGAVIPPSAGGKHLDGVVEATGGHPAAWMDPASTGFHAYSANQGLAQCRSCHGSDLSGGTTGVSCAQCHGASWATTCTMCHGGTDGPTGAPPRATWGNAADAVRVGTHTSHVAATHGLSAPVACAACHPMPADAFTPGHIDQATATVAFGGLAAQGGLAPTWSRAGPTCAGTYCHGATLLGGGQKTPTWTLADGSQRGCGSCHGAPPPNAFHTRTDLSCGSCHAGYSATAAAQATHVDGKLDYAVTCASCHGDPARAPTALNPQLAAAPPGGTHGETATTARAVGAHLQHLQGGTNSNGIACGECHAIPTSMLHADGAVSLTWGPLARTGGAAPAWSRTSNTCSGNWCHGAKLTGGSDTTPVWTTVNGTQDACGTCHGRPPSSGRHGASEHRVSCGYCHATNYTTSTVDKAFHVNGKVEVQGSRIRSYNSSTRSCYPTCHGTETW